MAVTELLRTESDGSLSFGNHTLNEKAKVEDYKYEGDLMKVKTYKPMTKLERNGLFVYESVPGTSCGVMTTNMGGKLSFNVELGDSPVEVSIIKA